MVLHPPLFKSRRFVQATKFTPFYSKEFLGGLGLKPSSGPEIQTLTNVAKLSLPANTSVDTQVRVSDGFYVSGFGDARDGFYFYSSLNSFYVKSLPYVGDGSDFICQPAWAFTNPLGNTDSIGTGAANPWDVTTWDGAILTLTHPALQQLAAASTAQGGVFVAGGTQDGVFTTRGTFGSKNYFVILGIGNAIGNPMEDFGSIGWFPARDPSPAFVLRSNDGTELYYSLSDVATPDLASNWKNAGDDTPASITVTSVSVGDLAAGFKIGDDTYVVSGSTNGRNRYVDALGNTDKDTTWNGVKWTSIAIDEINLGNVFAPFAGTPEVTVTKSNPAAELNWTSV